MLETWHVADASSSQALAASAVALLLEAPGQRDPGAKMLGFLNALTPVDYLSLVEYVPVSRGGAAAPAFFEGHSAAPYRNVTSECFAHYRQHFWREDQATRIAQQLHAASARPPQSVTALHFSAQDIAVPAWRKEIYEREHLADRLSFLYAPVPGSAWAVNLYRDRSHGVFTAGEIDTLLAVAPLLKLTHRGVLGHAAEGEAKQDRRARTARVTAALRRQAPELSARELEVCAHIACGVPADGIAAELGVAPSTVLTLRKRAYAKLGARGLGGGRMRLARLAC